MATNWIDALDERDALLDQEPEPTIKAVPNVEDSTELEAKKLPAASRRVKDPFKGFQLNKTVVASAVAIVGVVGVATASVLTLSNSVEEEQVVAPEEQSAGTVGVEAATSEGEEVVPASLVADKKVSIGSSCSTDVVEEVAQEDSPRGAVAVFESAYFAQDSQAVKDAVSPDSHMQEQDWDKVLKEAAPEGTTWCATMPPADGDAVDVDLEMSLPHERPVVYRQTATAEQHNGEWLITEISARED